MEPTFKGQTQSTDQSAWVAGCRLSTKKLSDSKTRRVGRRSVVSKRTTHSHRGSRTHWSFVLSHRKAGSRLFFVSRERAGKGCHTIYEKRGRKLRLAGGQSPRTIPFLSPYQSWMSPCFWIVFHGLLPNEEEGLPSTANWDSVWLADSLGEKRGWVWWQVWAIILVKIRTYYLLEKRNLFWLLWLRTHQLCLLLKETLDSVSGELALCCRLVDRKDQFWATLLSVIKKGSHCFFKLKIGWMPLDRLSLNRDSLAVNHSRQKDEPDPVIRHLSISALEQW